MDQECETEYKEAPGLGCQQRSVYAGERDK
jgi:hypothetical protein